jgi:cytochrome c oxidase cbb3-type subunit 3
MPGWWIWLFWITVIFAPIYILGVHVFGFVDTYDDDLAEGQAELAERRQAFEAANPSSEVDEAYLAAFSEDEVAIEAGSAIYQTNCMPCHGAAGEGGIGANLTDAYWIHGNSYTSMFEIVTDGVLEKGMTPWGSILSVEERAQVVAYVASLQGTNPPNAKAPEGELIES